MRTDSSQFEQFTLGIEEEFQIVDPNTRELRSHVSEILEEGRMLLGEQVKPEMIRSMIEVGTGICKVIKEARTDITNLLSILSTLVRKKGLEIVAAGTHPFSHWQDQKIFENARYELIVEENQMIARSLLTFGLHVHVGVVDSERAIQIMNAIRYSLPHVLALSTSSPFWLGVHTGLKSYHSEIFTRFPGPVYLTTSIPTARSNTTSSYSSKPDTSTMAKRSIGTCVRTRSSQRSSFAFAIFPPALMTRSLLLPFSRHWSQSSTNYSIKI
jgi:YbdK family carboxylate-amine ligase